MSKDNNNVKKFAVGAAIAAAAGYVAGILTAPKRGKETRQDISNTARKAKSEAERTLKNLQNELIGLIDQSKKQASKLSASAKQDLDSAVATAKSAREKARQILSGFHEGDADDKDLQKAISEVNKAIEHLRKFLKSDVSEQKNK
jgi:gas vesicle protein